MNKISSTKEKENIDTIEKAKIVKIAYMVPIFGRNLRKEF